MGRRNPRLPRCCQNIFQIHGSRGIAPVEQIPDGTLDDSTRRAVFRADLAPRYSTHAICRTCRYDSRLPEVLRPASPNSSAGARGIPRGVRSEEHTSELQSLMRTSYAVFCLKTKNNNIKQN